MENREPSYTVGGNANYYSHYGEQCGDSLRNWKLNCTSCLYIFEINSLSVASFAITFSHSEGSLFTLLIVSFVVQKLLILIRSHLFLLLFPKDPAVVYVGECFAYVFL